MRYLLLLLSMAVGVTAWMDEASNPRVDATGACVPAEATEIRHAGERRAFIFVIDSLAWEEAADAALMPNLAELRKSSSFARVQASRDAVTTPALRAAFTGADSFRVLGFVRNFVAGSRALDSIFGEAHRAGLRTAAWSDGAFDQFGSDIDAYRSNESAAAGGDEVARQLQAGEEALQTFLRGEFDVVALHVTFTDHAAHKRKLLPEPYRAAFRAADRFVGRLAEAVPPEDVLLVMGDHGHTSTGTHALGMDVPTFAAYRGRAFAEGYDFSPAEMTDHRYLLGFGLKTGLSTGYQGLPHPQALRPEGPLPAAYAMIARAQPVEEDRPWWPFLVMAAGVGGLGALWLGCVWQVRRGTLLPMAGAGLVAGIAFFAWGLLQAHARQWIHEPPVAVVESIWGAALFAGLIVCRFRGPRIAAWSLFGTGALLLYPTVYRYGSMSTLVPVWTLFLVLMAGALAWHRPVWSLAMAALAFLLIQPFALPDSFSFRFDSWRPLVPALAASTDCARMLTGLLCKGILVAVVARCSRWRFADLFCLCATWAAYYYLVRAPASFRWQFDCMLAALALTGILASRRPAKEHLSHHVFLLCLAVVAAGWCTLAFGIERIEWQCLYDWFSPLFVERHMAWLLPIIVGRYALPLILVRVVFRAVFPDHSGAAERRAIALVGLCVICILCVGLGLGRTMPGSSVYLESCQHAGVLWCVATGLAIPSPTRRARSASA